MDVKNKNNQKFKKEFLGVGNIVPHSWYSKITAGGGKPDFVAITILSELVFLYRKLGNPEIAESYSYYEKKFNLTKTQLQDATLRLHKNGIVERSFRTVEVHGRKFPNELHLKINLEKLAEISGDNDHSSNEGSALFENEENLFTGMVRNSSSLESEISDKHNSNKISLRKNRSKESSFFKYCFKGLARRGGDLSSFYPLEEDNCNKLQRISGREFNARAINEILLKLSKKYTHHNFANKAAFLGYMGKVLRHEMRDAVKISNETFKLNCNQDKEHSKREEFLESIETSKDTSLAGQLKRKLASVLCAESAYSLLKKFNSIDLEAGKASIKLNSRFEATESEQSIILSQVQAVYGIHIAKLEFTSKIIKTTPTTEITTGCYKGFWGQLRLRLINHLGQDGRAIDKSWFSKLDADLDQTDKTLNLRALSEFIKDWINRNYGHLLERFCSQHDYRVSLV